MFRATLKGLLARKLRLFLSGLAVVLGVMAVSGALILTDSVGQSFDTLFRIVNQNLDVQVTAVQHVDAENAGADQVVRPIPAGVVREVAVVPGVKNAIGGVIVNNARVVGRDGKVLAGPGPPSFGVGWRGEVGFVELRSGRGPVAPDEVAISAGLAKQTKFGVGDSIDVLTLQPKKVFRVVGVFGYTGGRDSLGGESRVSFTEKVAQELLLGELNTYSVINVIGEEGAEPDKLRDAISAALGGGYLVRTNAQVAADQAGDVAGFVDVIRNVLLGFAAVALFVGIFLILNTFSILIAQRTRELGLLRAIGASRTQVVVSVLIEAVAIGLIAATLGLGAGFGIAALLRTVMQAQTGVDLPGSALTLTTSAIVAAYVVGVLVTVVASLAPAVRASRTPPVAAMRDLDTKAKPVTVLTLTGGVLTLLGATGIGIALFARLGDSTAAVLLVGVLAAFIGIALLMPALTPPAVALLGGIFSWSVPGMLGRRNASRSPRRTAITAAALMVGITLVTGVSVLASSMKSSLEDLVKQTLAAQLIISGDLGGPAAPLYDPQVIERVKELPGVRDAVAIHFDVVQVKEEAIEVAAGDGRALSDIFGLKPSAGDLRGLGPGEIAIDEVLAKARGLGVGSVVELSTQRGGPRSYTVVGVFPESRLLPGPVLLSREDGVTGFRSPQATWGYISLAAGVDSSVVAQQVAALLKDNPEVAVHDQGGYVAQLTSQIDTAAVLLYVLLSLSITIAVLGIVNTLALSILERTRELGLLRAVGMYRGQVFRMVTIESIVIATFGSLLGMVVGALLGTAAVRALRDEFIHVLSIPWATIAVFMALAVAFGLIAAVIPALRGARINVLKAIAYE